LKKKTENFFYNKKVKKLEKEKTIIFVKFAPKRSALKWTSNKMGNAKKGHSKTGCDKIVEPKRHASKMTAILIIRAVIKAFNIGIPVHYTKQSCFVLYKCSKIFLNSFN